MKMWSTCNGQRVWTMPCLEMSGRIQPRHGPVAHKQQTQISLSIHTILVKFIEKKINLNKSFTSDMMPKRHVSARWQYHNVLLLVLCSSFCFQVSGCSMHNHGMEINDHISEGLSASTRNLLQMDEFPKGRYSIVDSQAFASPTVPGSLSGRLGNQTSRQYGTGGIPFTTSGAYSELQDFSQSGDPIILQKEPTNLIPWSATGKLVLSSGTVFI